MGMQVRSYLPPPTLEEDAEALKRAEREKNSRWRQQLEEQVAERARAKQEERLHTAMDELQEARKAEQGLVAARHWQVLRQRQQQEAMREELEHQIVSTRRMRTLEDWVEEQRQVTTAGARGRALYGPEAAEEVQGGWDEADSVVSGHSLCSYGTLGTSISNKFKHL